jgi:uncharacterized membrane protein
LATVFGTAQGWQLIELGISTGVVFAAVVLRMTSAHFRCFSTMIRASDWLSELTSRPG